MRGACAVWLVALVGAVAAPVEAQPAPGQEPWLGVIIVPGMRGVLVREIIDDSPAARAGLLIGDEILAVGTDSVAAPPDLISALGRRGPGNEVELALWRGGRLLRTASTLDTKPSEAEILHRRLVGKRAPGFRAPAVTGEGMGDLAGLHGRVVVLAFAAPGCSACSSLHRRLSRFVDRCAHADLAVFMLSAESRESLDAWSRNFRPSFAVLQDIGGMVARSYYVTQEPTVVVIDRSGEVLYAGIGDGDLDIALAAAERALERGAI
jgi:peroxiredoxin